MLGFLEDWTTRALNRLTIKDSQEPTNEESDSEEDKSASEEEAPLIKFARFVNGTLDLPPYEVKASQEKADFIEKDLPALVGDTAFWMDTLTVDQRNEKEALAIVQSIPTIFRIAGRTIAVLRVRVA
ncbi:hypothetical protein B0A49_10855 [Cryomyces minteri]|uniref:Uncharacterized protein n=1 Tax=Cryomyces minteri TaxID=331657 RepID=A0A4U0WJQ3_9PEZI|nr:hypothetical protein B0A49_10855 [Cryomyces minteri]